MEKLNLLFDAKVIKNIFCNDSGRSGIFFVAYNLLLKFIASSRFNIFLYCDFNSYSAISNLIKNYPEFINCRVYSNLNWLEKQISKILNSLYRNKIDRKSKLKKIVLKTILIFCKFLMLFVRIKRKFFSKKMDLNNFNIFFSPMHNFPIEIVENKKIKKYTILYDFIPIILPQYYPAVQEGKYWFLDLINSINKDNYYFAISENTKHDFIKNVPNIDADKVIVSLLAAGDNFYSCHNKDKFKEVKRKYNIPDDKKYLFSLCSLEPRKNLTMAIKAFIAFIQKHRIDDFVYILGGSAWKEFAEVMEKEIQEFEQYKSKIIKAGYIDDEDLASLYSNAEFFVYTSEYEGFGLPPLEAMKCGKAIITSNNSSLPEVVGDAGIMIDFDSLEQHIQSFETLYFNKKIREEYEQKAPIRAQEFSWDKCANIMIEEMCKNV